MIDRGIIKWQPFNSVAPSKEIVNKLAKKRQCVIKPILSEEQLQVIEKNLLEAYTNGTKATIEYYKNGTFIKIIEGIKSIDLNKKRIILDDNRAIYFNQIIRITN